MATDKQLGIWMDHSIAELIDSNSKNVMSTIESKFTYEVQEDAIHRGENHMHTKEQQMHEEYYKQIGSEILKYDHVLLFGPTNAKTELYNFLNKDSHFKNIKIDVEAADKMSDNQKNALVKNHFKNQ